MGKLDQDVQIKATPAVRMSEAPRLIDLLFSKASSLTNRWRALEVLIEFVFMEMMCLIIAGGKQSKPEANVAHL